MNGYSGVITPVVSKSCCICCISVPAQLLTCHLSCYPSHRSVPDPGSDVVPRWLGFRQSPAVLRARRGSVPGRTLLHGLGLLHCHGGHRAHFHLRRLLCSGRDRHLQWQGSGGDRGGQEPDLPPLSPDNHFLVCVWGGDEAEACSLRSTPALLLFLMRLAFEMEAAALFTTKTDFHFVSVLCVCGRNLQVPSFFSVCCLCLSDTRGAVCYCIHVQHVGATCSVNKCDYMYFVHSYDCRMMVSLIQAGLMMSLLPILVGKKKKKKEEEEENTGVFITKTQPANLDLLPFCHMWVLTQQGNHYSVRISGL